jgi:hypothetical protein
MTCWRDWLVYRLGGPKFGCRAARQRLKGEVIIVVRSLRHCKHRVLHERCKRRCKIALAPAFGPVSALDVLVRLRQKQVVWTRTTRVGSLWF